MSGSGEVRRALRALGRFERRRVRLRVSLAAVSLLAALLASLVGWEAVVGGGVRPVGYVLAFVAWALAVGFTVRAWGRGAPSALATADAVERAFPQARGVVRDAVSGAPGGLGAARVEAGREWVERRGVGRLDRAVGERERARVGRWRRVAVVAVLVGVAAVVARPVAARRVAETLRDPASLWRPGTWRVEPGDATVEHGGALDGRARFEGPGREEALVVEWRESDGRWRAESLARGPEGAWRWEALEASRDYRLRYGVRTSPTYRVEVAAPFGVAEARVRVAEGAWEPLAGRVLPAGTTVEIRGRASRPPAWAAIEVGGREIARLSVDGTAFSGSARLPEGTGRLRVTGPDGEPAEVGPFVVAGAGRAWAVILTPDADVARLSGSAAWVEARAGAPTGLAALVWETRDGRSGALADPAGTRDTTVAAVVPLGAGRAPGDTVTWRVAATPLSGAPVATPWRRAVLPVESELRRVAAEERAGAEAAVDRALERAEAALEGREDGERADQDLRAAADSLARAIDRTLADPGLPDDVARELEAQRDLLEGAAASEMAPRAGLPPDPEASARARAAILEAVRDRLETLERALARAAAADSLARLADRQRDLAEASRASDPAALELEVAPRQDALEEAAREALAEAAGEAPGERDGAEGDPSDAETGGNDAAGEPADPAEAGTDPARRRAESALGSAGEAVRSGDPARAAEAQEAAASAMGEAAESAREGAERAARASAAHRATLDRAAAESLFLAERQRALADRPGDDPADALARQQVVTSGLERSLQAMVDGVGGVPAQAGIAEAIGNAIHATMYARGAVADRSVEAATRATALDDAADALAALARALLLPGGSGGASGQTGQAGAEGRAGAASRELQSLAEAQAALADAMGGSDEPAGGNPDAAAAQREIGDRLEALRQALEEAGIDPATVEALARSVEESASRMERGLPGARSRSELRALAGRMRDLSRLVDRRREERRSETARPFVPARPGPLPDRARARRLDAEAALEGWRADLPAEALGAAERYLEALESAGVRAGEGEAP